MYKSRIKLREKAFSYINYGESEKEKVNIFLRKYLEWEKDQHHMNESILGGIREYVASGTSGMLLPSDEVGVLEVCMDCGAVSVYYKCYVPDPVKWLRDIITFWILEAMIMIADTPDFTIHQRLVSAKNNEVSLLKKTKDEAIDLYIKRRI